MAAPWWTSDSAGSRRRRPNGVRTTRGPSTRDDLIEIQRLYWQPKVVPQYPQQTAPNYYPHMVVAPLYYPMPTQQPSFYQQHPASNPATPAPNQLPPPSFSSSKHNARRFDRTSIPPVQRQRPQQQPRQKPKQAYNPSSFQGDENQANNHPLPAAPTPFVSPLTEANLKRHDAKFREIRQFGCARCRRTWWKQVEATKAVSRCRKCRMRYDAIPVSEAQGYGTFSCECGHDWTNRKAKGELQQDCKSCGRSVLPKKIEPPPRRTGAARSGNKHSCEGCGTGACRFTFVASQLHHSTGSTVSTTASVRTLASVSEGQIDSLEALVSAFQKLAHY